MSRVETQRKGCAFIHSLILILLHDILFFGMCYQGNIILNERLLEARSFVMLYDIKNSGCSQISFSWTFISNIWVLFERARLTSSVVTSNDYSAMCTPTLWNEIGFKCWFHMKKSRCICIPSDGFIECPPGMRSAWGAHILTTRSLCVEKKGVCMVYVHVHCLYPSWWGRRQTAPTDAAFNAV